MSSIFNKILFTLLSYLLTLKKYSLLRISFEILSLYKYKLHNSDKLTGIEGRQGLSFYNKKNRRLILHEFDF